jgi:hypothetical protein
MLYVRLMSRRAGLIVAVVGVVLAICIPVLAMVPGAPSSSSSGPHEAGCRIFPANNPLNQEIANAPVNPKSTRYIGSIGANVHLHADFGTAENYGMPYTVVGQAQRKVPIHFTEYADQSDPGPYPVPPNAPVEDPGEEGDHHVLVLQEDSCRLYELYQAHRKGVGWDAGSGAIFNLDSNKLRPEGWTSADAAGLPIFPLLARYPEVQAGQIDHALRVTVPNSQRGYIHPAIHFASRSSDLNLPPMGLRLRLKATFDLAPYHGEALVILQALKRYGLIVADNGKPWYISGAPDARWNNEDLDQLKNVPGSAFEAVSTGPVLHHG